MIVLFTSNIKGGVIQLNMQLVKELTEMGEDVKCFVPKGAVYTVNSNLKKKIVLYEGISKNLELLGSKIKVISSQIMSFAPDIVWFTDQMPCSCTVGARVARCCKTISTIHDVTYHPTSNNGIKARLYRWFLEQIKESFDTRVACRVLLSKESYDKYLHIHPENKNRILLLPLGAHVPDVVPFMPKELDSVIERPYILFIGRIDKYKGIGTLCQLYNKNKDIDFIMVIAGAGELSQDEFQFLKSDERIVLLNRYIEDGEFIGLMQMAYAVVLPYNEASQSGVIPIAYKFGCPVIVSAVKGLTQFVDDGSTGFICNNLNDYKLAINKLNTINRVAMGKACRKYYDANLDWKKNLKIILERIE